MNHRGQESTGPGGDQKSRLGLTREAQRKTAGPEAVAWYAKQNPAINVANTHLNVDMVNDGAGGFRPTSSIDEVVTYGDARVDRLNTALKPGHRFAVTAIGQLPWDYLEPDGTEYQPVDKQGVPKVFKTGPRAGEPIMEPRYRIKPGYEEKAEAYWADWLEFQFQLLPDGQTGAHGYSINMDESRPHIQLLSDPFEPAPSKKRPDALKNGFSRAFGSHPKDLLVPKLDASGQPVVSDDGEPVLVREGASRKMERYQAEFRAFMVARGHEVELERDEARHDRHLGLQDYKDLQHSQREVADTAEHLDIELATVADEREHYDEASVFVIQEAVETELGEVMAQSQAIEADLAEAREELAAERQQWEEVEKPRLVEAVTDEAKKAARTAWEADEQPALVEAAETEAQEIKNKALVAWEETEKPALVSLVTRSTRQEVEKVTSADRQAAADDRQAAAEVKQQAEADRQAAARRLADLTSVTREDATDLWNHALLEKLEAMPMRVKNKATGEMEKKSVLEIAESLTARGFPDAVDSVTRGERKIRGQAELRKASRFLRAADERAQAQSRGKEGGRSLGD